MSPSANEGDDDMHELRIRSPSAPFQHAGAEGSRGVSAWGGALGERWSPAAFVPMTHGLIIDLDLNLS